MSQERRSDAAVAADTPAAAPTDDSARFAARRRFIKQAAIAAPAVMTLHGGQALAQASFTLSACIAERSEMGQVAQNAIGDEMYFVVDVNPDGSVRSVTEADKDTLGAQTVTASCMASLI